MQRFNMSEAVQNVTSRESNRRDVVVGPAMKLAQLLTIPAQRGASCRAKSLGIFAQLVQASTQALHALASRMSAWRAVGHASPAYAPCACAGMASRRSMSGAGQQRLPRWATAPDID